MTLLSLRMNIAFNIQRMSRLWSEEPSRGLFPREGSWRSTAITELIKVDETPRGVIVTEFSPQQRCPHRSMWLVCSFGHSQRSQPHRENCENGGFRRWYPEENIHFTPYQITSMYEFKENIPPLESLEIFAILKTVTQNQYMCVCLQQTHICRHIFHFLATTAQLQCCAFCAATHTAMCYNSMFIAAALRIIAQTALGCLGIDPH